ncbi:hypothetical protein DFH27DRAFT_653996 [Peziza echinospora]|nr:hypothetical protein DFH27DRAFT_653996 [Peziza echinospora]
MIGRVLAVDERGGRAGGRAGGLVRTAESREAAKLTHTIPFTLVTAINTPQTPLQTPIPNTSFTEPMIASSTKKSPSKNSSQIAKPSTASTSPGAEDAVSPTSPQTSASPLQGRIRASSSCPYLPIFGGLSGPASPAEVTKEVAFGGVVDNSGKFSPRIIESEGGYFAIRNAGPISGGELQPGSPRRPSSSTSLVTTGSSTIISRECGWGEMVGIEAEGGGTVLHHHHHHHHQFLYHQRRTSSGNHESPEELLLRVKTKSSSSNLSFHQIHPPTTPIQRSSSSLSLSFTPTGASAVATATHTTITSTIIGPAATSVGSSSSGNLPTSAATSSVSKTNAKSSTPRSNSKTSPKSSLRLRLPPQPKVNPDTLGLGVHPLLHHTYYPHHRFFPSTPDGHRVQERRRDSAPAGLLLPAIQPRTGDWLLTPPDEEGGMVWQTPTPSDISDNMADSQEIVEGEDVDSTKATERQTDIDRGVQKDDAMPKEDQTSSEDMVSEKEGGEGDAVEVESVVDDDIGWGLGEEWLRGAAAVILSSLSQEQINSEAIRILSYTLPCPLPSSPDPSLVAVGASTTSTQQDRLPESAARAPEAAALAGEQLSPSVTARCNSKRPNASTIPVGCRDGVTTTIHTITSAIQRHCERLGNNRVYINVSHAIPPHIPLTKLLSIPPISGPLSSHTTMSGFFDTPFSGSVSSENGGYFSPTVFNSIVVSPNITPGPRPQHFPSMCNPILPPNSLHFSILERFIPPNTVADDSNMFSPTASLLLDRLLELHENGGTLLFIYPTKTGAKEFVKNILGPVLDPLLRKLMVIHHLQHDLLWRIRNMNAVEGMADWDDMNSRMENLCNALTKGGLPVKVSYASTAKLRLNDESWREWWSQQEEMRIKDIMMTRQSGSSAPPPSQQSSTIPAGIDYTMDQSPAMTLPVPSPKQTGAPRKPVATVPPKREYPREAPPRSIDLTAPQLLSPRFVAPLSPLSPEASAYYLGIRSTNLPTTGPITTTHPSMSSNSGGFTTGYGFPGDLAREILDGVRAPAVRPSSKGMGEAVMASALAGSSGNSLVSQAMGGVVGQSAGRREGSIHRGNSGSGSASGNPWMVKRRSEESIEVGVFVLQRMRRTGTGTGTGR